MVSTSTRRFPSTAIEAAVWAAAGEDTSTAASVAATGTANMIRAANKPPRTRIPNIMRNAPLSFRCRPAPPRTGRFPFAALLVANFAGAANADIAVRFHFHSKTLPMGNVTKKPLHDAARCRMSL